jgi:chromosome segregation ATPase
MSSTTATETSNLSSRQQADLDNLQRLRKDIADNAQLIQAVASQMAQNNDHIGSLQKKINDNQDSIEITEKRIKKIDAQNYNLRFVAITLFLILAGITITLVILNQYDII